ncbi:MAG: RNA methyltransferase [Schwartzia sp.]|nr:RNA methyltransferase [Schwartzia sp. (in: firmicutes)]
MERIESASNARIKWAAALHQRKAREEEDAFVAEGVRLAEEAAASGWETLLCLVTEEALRGERVRVLTEGLESRGCPVYLVSERVYRKAAATVTPQGVMLAVRRRRAALSSVLSGGTPLVAVLDGVRDPGNAGTILRTADATGCTALVALEGTTDLFADKAVRSSMGSLFHLPVIHRVTRREWLDFAAARGLRLFAAMLDREARPHLEADFRVPAAVVFGSEGSGVSDEIAGASSPVHIPMAGGAESLNVASSAAIILYEAFRQRRYEK